MDLVLMVFPEPLLVIIEGPPGEFLVFEELRMLRGVRASFWWCLFWWDCC